MKILGILLVAIGVLLFVYKGVTYTTHKKIIDAGPIEVTKEEQHRLPYSPVAAGIALAGGIVLIVLSVKKTT